MPMSVATRKLVQVAAASLLALAAGAGPSRAQNGRMLVIPASDGYGFDECLAGNQACGHVIADAWCESHGMSGALSFGRSDDVTASTGRADPASKAPEPGSFIINCKE